LAATVLQGLGICHVLEESTVNRIRATRRNSYCVTGYKVEEVQLMKAQGHVNNYLGRFQVQDGKLLLSVGKMSTQNIYILKTKELILFEASI
jgi:hypothetical protein